MAEGQGARMGWLVMAVVVLIIGLLAGVALHPELVLEEARLPVSIVPDEAVRAGAAWKVAGRWMPDGPASLADATASFQVEFKSVPGWVTPESVIVTRDAPMQVIRAVYSPRVLRPRTLLRLHGSNTIGARLGPELARRYLVWLGADSVGDIESSSPEERTIEGVFSARGESLRIEIEAHGSSTGFTDMDAGVCDVAMASRRIKDAEVTRLARFGNMKSLDCEYVIALDGIAVIVNMANPLSVLTKARISDIFSGKIRDWSEIGAGSGSIEVHARDDNSGTYDTFKHLVLGTDALVAAAVRHESNEELSAAVAASPLAIGFCGLPYINKSKELAVQDEGMPIRPSQFTVSTEDYPLARRLYLYAPSLNRSRQINEFLDFVLSADGQKAVQRFGFVSLDIAQVDATPPLESGQAVEVGTVGAPESTGSADAQLSPVMGPAQGEENASSTAAAPEVAPVAVGSATGLMLEGLVPVNANVLQEYAHAVRNARRLPVNFRFHSGSFDLDNKALRDLERVAGLCRQQSRHVVLVGFSDAVGDYTKNLALSVRRAEEVAGRLQELGVTVDTVLGAGEEAPVASNQDNDSRERNRRVEIWIQ